MKISLEIVEINCDNAMLERKMVKLVCKTFARGRYVSLDLSISNFLPVIRDIEIGEISRL